MMLFNIWKDKVNPFKTEVILFCVLCSGLLLSSGSCLTYFSKERTIGPLPNVSSRPVPISYRTVKVYNLDEALAIVRRTLRGAKDLANKILLAFDLSKQAFDLSKQAADLADNVFQVEHYAVNSMIEFIQGLAVELRVDLKEVDEQEDLLKQGLNKEANITAEIIALADFAEYAVADALSAAKLAVKAVRKIALIKSCIESRPIVNQEEDLEIVSEDVEKVVKIVEKTILKSLEVAVELGRTAELFGQLAKRYAVGSSEAVVNTLVAKSVSLNTVETGQTAIIIGKVSVALGKAAEAFGRTAPLFAQAAIKAVESLEEQITIKFHVNTVGEEQERKGKIAESLGTIAQSFGKKAIKIGQSVARTEQAVE